MNKQYEPQIFETPFRHLDYALVRNKEQLDWFLKEVNCANVDIEFCGLGVLAEVVSFSDENGYRFAICSIDESLGDKCSQIEAYSIIAHESVHIWQSLREAMFEKDPSAEFEAYSIQQIYFDLLGAYEQSESVRLKQNDKEKANESKLGLFKKRLLKYLQSK